MDTQLSEMQIDWSKIEDHPHQAVRFFKIMMRLEFALKELGFAESNGRSIRLQRCRYVRERLPKQFLRGFRDSRSLTVLLDRPPSYQIVTRGGGLSWHRAEPVTTTTELLHAVWRVRNNLFHGGKSGDPHRDRNDELIADSITVISELLQHDQDLHTLFAGRY